MAKIEIVRQGQITKPQDFVDLHIVDWGRYTYGNVLDAMQGLSQRLISCWYTIIKCDLTKEPLLEGFDWEHVGNHVSTGHSYWSYFKRCFPKSEISFSDAPDFSGQFVFNDGTIKRFYGDIGVVSASAFFLDAVPRMREGDLWISVNDDHQTIIEASYDIAGFISNKLAQSFDSRAEPEESSEAHDHD